MSIHPTAIVAPGVRLGHDVTVGPFAYIEDQVVLGDGCIIGPHVTVHRYTTLGDGCRVHSGAVIGDLPQDLAFADSETFVRIGARCDIREGVTIHRGTKDGSCTVVGSDCLLMACSHVGHNSLLGNHVIMANGALLAGYTEVGDRVFISGNCLVHQFTRIGKLAMLSGGSAVQMDVPPFCITRSLTSNTVLSLNVIGLRRSGYTSDDRKQIKNAFDVLYRSGLSVPQAVQRLEWGSPCTAVQELCEFVRTSKRGICKFFRDLKDQDGNAEAAAA